MNNSRSGIRRITRASILLIILMGVALLFGAITAFADNTAQTAVNIVKECSVTASSYNAGLGNLWNSSNDAAFIVKGDGEQYISVDLKGNAAQGIYIKWARNPGPWVLESTLADGQVIRREQGAFSIMQEYAELPADTASFRMITDNGREIPLRLLELEVYSPGTLPASVHMWQPTPATAEIMMVSTHQDDELLYFGGAIPYYAAEKKYNTVVVYTAFENDRRLHEALEGLWVCGARQHPIFFGYQDRYCETIDRARDFWDEYSVIKSLTEILVRYRPQVVVSQDINGEYGHGQHLLTVHCLRKALSNAENAEYLEKNLPGMQPWSVSKCYLHLYWENRITMPWGELTVESAGGVSSLELAREAFKCHSSQQIRGYVVGTTPRTYDCRKFGLYWTKVGKDAAGNDFFENIVPRYIDAQPQGAVPAYLERTSRGGWHYRVVSEMWSGSDYLRYCTVNGAQGWFAADVTGSLLEPRVPVTLALDDSSLPLSEYNTLTQISDSPRVFRYDNGMLINGLYVRYCSVGTGQSAFYLSDANGVLLEPYQQIHVAAEAMQELSLPRVTLMTEGDGIDLVKVVIIVMCVLLVFAALALSVAVMRLNSVRNKRNRYRRR